MTLPKKVPLLPLVVLLLLGFAFVQPTTVRAANSNDPSAPVGIIPTLVAGNPALCPGGVRIDPPAAGVYPLDAFGNTVTIVIGSTPDGQVFSWSLSSSSVVIDQVVAKGGSDANLYDYTAVNPRPTADGNLHSPVNASGKYANLSHIDFCFHYQLTATKTANATYTRTYTWDITKRVAPDAHSGFAGDTFSSDYDVVVDQTVTDSAFAVSGDITVNNPTPFTVNFSVSDSVGGTSATVNCPTNSLASGASTTCTYSVSLGAKTDGVNIATITSNTDGVEGTTASANYAFGDPTTIVGYPTVNVTDSVQGPLGSASDDKTFEYSDDFACPRDTSLYVNGVYSFQAPNTATIDETGQSDDATVTVTCYALRVSKTANASLTRTWDWTIAKTGDQTDLTLSTGQSFVVNYDVTVSASSADSDWAVTGDISVHNPAPMAATINAVADVVSGVGAATVNCGVAFPYTLATSGTLNCSYSLDLPDGTARTNTATATLQNTPSGATDFTGEAAVSFSSATVTQVDECIDVTDDKYGSLGTVCANQLPKTLAYSLTVGPYTVCGDYTFVNVASFETNDTGTTGSDDHTVTVNIPCGGCTLTQGYWKTHSDRGPAPYDDAWKNLGPLEEDTLFFNSTKTWYVVFGTPPAGNAYYNLAHQYMAAKLNILNGAATTPAVDAAIAGAEALFAAQGVNDTTLTRAERTLALGYASTLDQYNNGIIGPGHCSEGTGTGGLGFEEAAQRLFLPTIRNR